MRETNHDYQGCLVGDFYNKQCTGEFDTWQDFKENFTGFNADKTYDDRYHFVFRWDIHNYDETEKTYTLELCIMLQRKGIYIHNWINDINQETLDTEVKEWLKCRREYINKLWKIEE